jgi:hypothetical protein
VHVEGAELLSDCCRKVLHICNCPVFHHNALCEAFASILWIVERLQDLLIEGSQCNPHVPVELSLLWIIDSSPPESVKDLLVQHNKGLPA